MPNVKIHVANLKEFEAVMRTSPKIIGRHLQDAIIAASNIFVAGTKQNIRTGREMWKPPIDTGYMWNHIFGSIYPLRAEINATADYAVFVHEGTRFMQGRPFFEITAKTEELAIQKAFENEINQALKEITNG